MGRGRFRIWHKAVALAPLLLLLIAGPGQQLLRCQLDGLLRATCCCPAGKVAGSRAPVLEAQGCCDRVAVAAAAVPAEAAAVPGAHADVVAAQALAVAPGPLPEPSLRPVVARAYHGPPRGRPPILLQKSAFLI